MEKDFWIKRREESKIGFHEGETNAMLLAHFEKLRLKKESRVFVPLCGKTRDIAWLLSQGMRVVGVELAELAVQQLFADLEVEAQITKNGLHTLYSSNGLDVYVGDLFDIDAVQLGTVDAIYDRAALVALPLETRRRYANHLVGITQKAPQLIVSFEYDQEEMDGPPFSVNGEEIDAHYSDQYQLQLLEKKSIPGGLKGVVEADALAWLAH